MRRMLPARVVPGKRLVGVGFLVALLLATPLSGQEFVDRAIRPAEGIGPLRLGMTIEQVNGALGRPPDGEATEGALRTYRWNLQGSVHTAAGPIATLNVTVGSGGTAEVIATTSSAFATAGGNGIGMNLSGFKEEFGAAFRGFKDNAGGRHLRFDTAGLALTYDIRGPGQTTVRALSVFPKAAAMPGPGPAILPGVGIGPVRIGMSLEEAARGMGRGPDARGSGLVVWFLPERDIFGDQAWLYVFFDNRGTVDLIMTEGPSQRTPQGNGPGVDIVELQAEFGVAFRSAPLVIPGQTSFIGIWYDPVRIVGFYHPSDASKRIQLIGVFK